MIAMRSCQKCHRRFDAVYPSNKTICPMCEQGEMFRGEFTEDDVFVPDVREPSEEPYSQTGKDRRKLEKLFSLNCSMSWDDEEIDEDDFLSGEAVLEQAEDDADIFTPLLADVGTPKLPVQTVPAQEDGNPGGAEKRPHSTKAKKTTETIHMKLWKDPYMKGGGK